MRFEHDPEASLQVLEVLHTHGFTHQTRHPVAPLVVQAFHNTGLATTLATRPVLPRAKQLGIGFVVVGVDQLATILARQRKPEVAQTPQGAVTDEEAHHLVSPARDGDPQILVAPFEAEADHSFVHLQGIALDRR